MWASARSLTLILLLGGNVNVHAETFESASDIGSATTSASGEVPSEVDECHRLVQNGRFHLAVETCQRALRTSLISY